MPTDGLTRQRRVNTRRKPTQARRDPDHRSDVAGILLLAFSAILIVALALDNRGLLGNSLAFIFTTFLGQGAWVVPVVLALGGVSLIFGHARFQPTRVTWGIMLIFLGVLGGMAKESGGEFFLNEVMASSGGYIGAVVGWALTGLLGVGKIVAVVAMVAIGVLLCINQPIAEILENLKNAARNQKIDQKVKEAVSSLRTDKSTDLPEEKPARPSRESVAQRRAAVAMGETLDEEEVAKPRPKLRLNTEEREPVLDISHHEPKDGYTLPPLDLLVPTDNKKRRDPKEVQRNIETLEDTLEQFKIDSSVVAVAQGPSITRYEVQVGPGIKVNRIVNLADNIAMALAASHVRVEAPIPGKAAVGIEIPNAVRQMVTLREMCDNLEFHDAGVRLCLALGKDVSGTHKYTDLTRMPHLLVGGATNSGKSICLASIIMSLILKMTPKDLRLVMIDPKRVELTLFEGLPHLMCPVVKDVKEAAGVLRAVVREMDRRYDQFSDAGVRNIDGWNAKATFQERLPYIVVIVDELADLMIQCGNEVEHSICRLAQLARATGIHLVIATQRPSVDVITGTIKNNISSRVAFAVSSGIDSRTILDSVGAEDLIGRGDMLFLPIDATKPVRIQGCYVSEKEIEDVCTFWRKQEKPHYVINPAEVAIRDRENQIKDEQEADPLFSDAVRFVVERNQASTSMIQRKFSIGFQRASRILDMMEEHGVVGPRDGSRPREILVDPMQAEALLGNSDYDSPLPDGAYIDD